MNKDKMLYNLKTIFEGVKKYIGKDFMMGTIVPVYIYTKYKDDPIGMYARIYKIDGEIIVDINNDLFGIYKTNDSYEIKCIHKEVNIRGNAIRFDIANVNLSNKIYQYDAYDNESRNYFMYLAKRFENASNTFNNFDDILKNMSKEELNYLIDSDWWGDFNKRFNEIKDRNDLKGR